METLVTEIGGMYFVSDSFLIRHLKCYEKNKEKSFKNGTNINGS